MTVIPAHLHVSLGPSAALLEHCADVFRAFTLLQKIRGHWIQAVVWYPRKPQPLTSKRRLGGGGLKWRWSGAASVVWWAAKPLNLKLHADRQPWAGLIHGQSLPVVTGTAANCCMVVGMADRP